MEIRKKGNKLKNTKKIGLNYTYRCVLLYYIANMLGLNNHYI